MIWLILYLQGLEQTTFSMMDQTTGCSLVSDGVECILINKKFFLHHLSDDMAKKIRKTVKRTNEPQREKTYLLKSAYNEDSNQPAHSRRGRQKLFIRDIEASVL